MTIDKFAIAVLNETLNASKILYVQLRAREKPWVLISPFFFFFLIFPFCLFMVVSSSYPKVQYLQVFFSVFKFLVKVDFLGESGSSFLTVRLHLSCHILYVPIYIPKQTLRSQHGTDIASRVSHLEFSLWLSSEISDSFHEGSKVFEYV